MWRPDVWTILYAATLLLVHVTVTRGTGTLPQGLHDSVGASAQTVLSRPWAQLTAQWFHSSWGHLGYNLLVLLATMPLAVAAFGPRAVAWAWVASALGGFLVDLAFILPLAGLWQHAAAAVEPRLVGASIAIFAGAGMAWSTWDAVGPKAVVAVLFVGYEVTLAYLGVTQPFVWGFHIAGGILGAGMGYAMAGR